MMSFQTRVCSERKEFAPRGANSFLKELTLILKRGKNSIVRVASPESVAFYLNDDLLRLRQSCLSKQDLYPVYSMYIK